MRPLLLLLAPLLPLLALMMVRAGDGHAAGATPPTTPPRIGPTPVDLPSTSMILCPLLPGKQQGNIDKVAYSPDGRALLASGGDFVRLFDPGSGRPLAAYKPGGFQDNGALAYSPDGRALLAPCAPRRLALLEPATGRPVRGLDPPPAPEPRWAAAAAYSPDGRAVAGSFGNGEVPLWDAATGRLTHVLPAHIIPAHPAGPNNPYIQPAAPVPVLSLAFSPDGATLYGSSRRLLRAWDVAGGRERPMDRPDGCYFGGLAVSPDGATLAVGQAHQAEGAKARTYSIALWDAATGRRKTELAAEAWALALAYLPGGRSLVTVDDQQVVRLWDLATGRPVAAARFDPFYEFGPGSNASSLAVSPDGRQVAIGGSGSGSGSILGVVGLVEVDGQKLGPWKP